MRIASLSLVLLCASGCTDLVTTEVGADRVAPIEIEGSIPGVPTDLEGCPTATVPIRWADARDATVTSAPSDTECEVTVRATEALIVDRATIEAQSQSIGAFDETALVGVDLELVELVLTDDDGRSLEDAVRQASVLVDGQPLYEGVAVGPQSPPPRSSLPESTVATFREALAAPRDVRADLELRFTFTDADAIPKRVGLGLVLQPILIVDVVRAAL